MSNHTHHQAAVVRFLIARFDDEGRALRQQARRNRILAGPEPTALRNRRAYVLANRQVLGHVQHLLVLRDLPIEEPVRVLAMNMVRAMASPYVDHVSFRPEWVVADRVREVAQ